MVGREVAGFVRVTIQIENHDGGKAVVTGANRDVLAETNGALHRPCAIPK